VAHAPSVPNQSVWHRELEGGSQANLDSIKRPGRDWSVFEKRAILHAIIERLWEGGRRSTDTDGEQALHAEIATEEEDPESDGIEQRLERAATGIAGS
jgi:hypothetical protein